MRTTKRSTTLIDANVILRYLIPDNTDQSRLAIEILENQTVFVSEAILLEVVYVLSSVYKQSREDIGDLLTVLFSSKSVQLSNKRAVLYAIDEYVLRSLAFADLLLYAYHVKDGYEIITFDKKLNKLIERYNQTEVTP